MIEIDDLDAGVSKIPTIKLITFDAIMMFPSTLGPLPDFPVKFLTKLCLSQAKIVLRPHTGLERQIRRNVGLKLACRRMLDKRAGVLINS